MIDSERNIDSHSPLTIISNGECLCCCMRITVQPPLPLPLLCSLPVLAIHFHLFSSPFIISPLLSSCLLYWPPPCWAVVSLQPPQSSPHRESWRQSKSSPLSSGWVTSNLAPQALLQACGPESWQLREAIVSERLTTHGSHCRKDTHTSWRIQSHILPQHNSFCLTSMKM